MRRFWGAQAPRLVVSAPSPKPFVIQAEKANARRVPQQARRQRSPEQMRARNTLLFFLHSLLFVYLACFVDNLF